MRPLSLLACLLLIGCGPIGVGPTKPVEPPVVQTIEDASRVGFSLYRAALSDTFETLARDIEQDRIRDDEQLADRMESLTKAARLEAFNEFRAAWQRAADELDDWDATERAARCREAAKGFAR